MNQSFCKNGHQRWPNPDLLRMFTVQRRNVWLLHQQWQGSAFNDVTNDFMWFSFFSGWKPAGWWSDHRLMEAIKAEARAHRSDLLTDEEVLLSLLLLPPLLYYLLGHFSWAGWCWSWSVSAPAAALHRHLPPLSFSPGSHLVLTRLSGCLFLACVNPPGCPLRLVCSSICVITPVMLMKTEMPPWYFTPMFILMFTNWTLLD